MDKASRLKQTLRDVKLEKIRPALEAVRKVIKEQGFTDMAADWAVATLADSAVDPEAFERSRIAIQELREADEEAEAEKKPKRVPDKE